MTTLSRPLPSAPTPDAPRLESATRWNRAYLALFALYILVGWAVRLGGWWHGDAVWFVWAANQLTLHGSFDMYSLHLVPEFAPPEGIAYSYAPLLALIIAPFTWLSYALGGGDQDAYRIMALPLVVLDTVALYQLRGLIKRWWPAVEEQYLFLGTVLTLFLTSFLLSTAYKGHVEGLVLLFLVLTLRLLPRHLLWSGLCAGLALAAKHPTAILVLLPIGLVILAGGRPDPAASTSDSPSAPAPLRQGLRDAVLWGGGAFAVFALIMLPAVLTNSGAVYYAFVTLPENLIQLGPGLPKWINMIASQVAPGAGAVQVQDALLRYSNIAMLVVVALVPLLIIVWARRHGRLITIRDTRLWGLMAFNLLVSLVLAKWIAEHYYPLPLLVLFVWDLIRTTPQAATDPARPRTFPWLGATAIIGYRAITQIQTYPGADWAQFRLPWLEDGLLFGFFAILVGLILRVLMQDSAARPHLVTESTAPPDLYPEHVPPLTATQ